MASIGLLTCLLVSTVCTLKTHDSADDRQRLKREAGDVETTPEAQTTQTHSNTNIFQVLNHTIQLENRLFNTGLSMQNRILYGAMAVAHGLLKAAVVVINGVINYAVPVAHGLLNMAGIEPDPVQGMNLSLFEGYREKLEEYARQRLRREVPRQTLKKYAHQQEASADLNESKWNEYEFNNPRKWTSERKREKSEDMKAYWDQAKAEGNTGRLEKIREKMRAYWKEKKEQSNTEWRRELSEKLKKYWQKQKELSAVQRSKHIDKLRTKMTTYWDKLEKEGTVVDRAKTYSQMLDRYYGVFRNETDPERWKEVFDQKGEKIFQMSQTMYDYWRKQKELEADLKGNHTHKIKAKMKEYWNKMNQEGDTSRLIIQSQYMRDYWRRLREKQTNATDILSR